MNKYQESLNSFKKIIEKENPKKVKNIKEYYKEKYYLDGDCEIVKKIVGRCPSCNQKVTDFQFRCKCHQVLDWRD